MFTSNSFGKNCAAMPENSSPGRCNTTNRFPVGITSVGDENQHIRIQLAVHKYNNSSSCSPNNRRSLISPIKHSFFKNPRKSKNFEGDADLASKAEKKCENRYEGVGNFPTVHLRKRAVLYRPIKKFNEVKVPYPELPVNRFLNHLPELCSDFKSSTRSVLDVLQNMSSKGIHPKDENDFTRYGSRGLGGDMPVDGAEISRPLFVQKPKANIVCTKDSTTQTLSPVNLDMSVTPGVSSAEPDTSDPRAELRRKLAKQNNEIFASLSSSISSTFALKRRIDKISGFKEERSRSDASSVKKPKIVNNQSINFKTSNTSNGINCLQPNTNDSSAKINRKSKLSEAGTTSPNKDRLTTIFLDMENTSPKAQMFQKFVKNTESVSNVSQNGLLSNSVDFGKKSESAVINCTTEPKTSLINETNSNVTSLGTYSFAAIESINKTKDSQSSGAVSKFVVSSTKTDNVITVNSSPKTNSSSQFKFEAPAKTNIKVNISEKSSATNWTRENPSVATPITLTVNKISETENKITSMSPVTDDFRSCNANAATDSNQTTLQSYAHVTSENSELKTVDFGTFKFGSNGNLSSRISSPEAESEMKKEVSLTTDLKNGTTIKFSNTHNLATPQLGSEANNSGFSGPEVTSNNNSTQITSPININTNFVFGKTLLTNQEVNSVSTNSKNSQEKTEVSKNGFTFNKDLSTAPISTVMTNNTANNTSSNKISNDSYNKQNNCNVNSGSEMSSSILGQTSQSPPFVFGQKQACVETLKSNENNAFDSGQNRVQNLSQPKDDCQKENSESLKNVFKTSEPPVSTAIFPTSNSISDHSSPLSQSIKSITTTAQTKGNSLFTNSLFGSNALGQKSPILSGGEPKASDSPFNQSKNPQSLAFTFGQKSTDQNSNQSVSSETNESGQNNQAKLFSFGQTPSTQPSTSIKAFSPGSTESTMFGQNLLKVDSQQTANSSPFVQNISQAAAVSQNNQVPTFTPSTAAESTNNLENKSGAVSFGSIPTTAIFGQNTSTFASKGTSFFPSTTASLSGFGASSIQSNTKFGGSTFQTNSGFGVPTTTQSTVQFGTPATTQVTINFGASTAFINTTAGPVTSTFGASATTQPTTVFGLNSSSQLSSFGQPFAPDKATPTTYGISSNNIFESSNITPSSTSTAGFNSSTTTNNFSAPAGQSIFGSKTSTNQDDIFRQAAKIQAPAFGNNSTQGYGTQNKFSFGISTSNVPGFTTSPPKATSSGVFTFGATTSTPGSASSFGSGGTTTGSSSIRTPFSFNTQNNNAFKFGTSTTKENSVFDSSNANTLTFGTQMNNNNTLDAKPATPAFNFGSPQMPSTATFNFGSAPTPVFSFGTSGSTSSSSTFSFNTPQPGGVVFGQGTPSPAPSFSVPGTFNIGSGSTQSRPRASSRLRRRP